MKRSRKKPPPTARAEQIRKATENVAETTKRINQDPRLVSALQKLRAVMPGDSALDEPVELPGKRQPQVFNRLLSDVSDRRPSALGEAGLGALQLWQAMADSQEEDPGETELAIVFTDLVEFSTWALEAGDDNAIELLHSVSAAIEPPVLKQKGKVVKRLGDGMMAVFTDAGSGIKALSAAQQRLTKVEVEGYKPQMRAGMHVGCPRKVEDDYFGVDVNVAARVAEAATAGELLISGEALEALGDATKVKTEPRSTLVAKGVPDDFELFAVTLS